MPASGGRRRKAIRTRMELAGATNIAPGEYLMRRVRAKTFLRARIGIGAKAAPESPPAVRLPVPADREPVTGDANGADLAVSRFHAGGNMVSLPSNRLREVIHAPLPVCRSKGQGRGCGLFWLAFCAHRWGRGSHSLVELNGQTHIIPSLHTLLGAFTGRLNGAGNTSRTPTNNSRDGFCQKGAE